MVQEMGLRENLKMYWKMTDLGSLTRRYIVIGMFDGALTVAAIVLAALSAHLFFFAQIDVVAIVIAGLGAAVGLAISSGWGAYEAERVERRRELDHLEKMMQRPMDGCMVDRAIRFATFWASFIHGASPLPASLLPLVPIILFSSDFVFGAIVSVVVTLILLFMLGIWMGRIGKTNSLYSGIRMVIAALITAAICVLIGGIHRPVP